MPREYIGYTAAYINYFLIRTSVMLFVLRLLPSYKKKEARLIYVMFLVNFVISAFACLTFGLSCRPFKANWDAVPSKHCFSKKLLVIVNQVNASMVSPFRA